jgi:poly(A) polymerase
VFFGREIIEVATFRAAHRDGMDGITDEDGRIMRDNVFGTIEEDALRRDFTVNALYYDISDFSVIDFVGAMDDLRERVLRLIGDPHTRYSEDPVRMLRGVRLAAKLNFSIHPETEQPLHQLGYLLAEMPPARLFDEVLKLFQAGHAVRSFEMLRRYDLLRYLFPLADACLNNGDRTIEKFMIQALRNTDTRVAEGKPITPAYLYAVFLWPAVRERARQMEAFGAAPADALQQAASQVTRDQLQATALPRRFASPMHEIWSLQSRLVNSVGKRALRLLGHPRFRAGYDFLCLRAQAGADLEECCHWWTEIQAKDPQGQAAMARRQQASSSKRRRRHHPKASAQGSEGRA